MKLSVTKVCITYLLLLFLVSIAMVFIPGLDVNAFDPNVVITGPQSPSLTHWLGTDDLGRDLLLRCLDGAKISLLVALVSVTISTTIGTLLGVLAGFFRPLDAIVMRFVDMMMAIPTLFLILILQVILTPSIWTVVSVIGLTSWMGTTRLVRAEVLSIKERVFVKAATARGIPTSRLLFKHVLPHALNPVIVSAMLGMGSAILIESVLSFLGLGVQPPYASWGNLLENSLKYLKEAPWMTLAPGAFITISVLSIHFIGDSLRAKLDVKDRA